MRWFVVASMLLLIGGCSGGGVPLPGDAMAVVWEQTYGMESTARPSITWHDDCRTTDDGVGKDRAVSIKNGCVQAIVYATGAIELQSATLISESTFALALEEWKRMLVASEFAPIDGAEVKTANNALVAVGL